MAHQTDEPLYVTKSWLPPLEELAPLLEEIWRNRVLSNAGPIHQRFELALSEYLGVPYVSLVANATQGLVVALRRLKLEGEVITTPFTFVATAHAIVEAGLRPVFVDVQPGTFALDPDQLEASITPRTCAVMPVHCFGYACDVERMAAVAARHNLRVIYDAAHAFGIRDSGGSVLRHGDASVLSFHATKVFTTFEGGAVVSPDSASKEAIDQLRNFGFRGESVEAIGTNAKMNEFSAAVGLVLLRHVDRLIAERGECDRVYRELLREVPGVTPLVWPADQSRNYYNFPVLIEDDFGISCEELVLRMRRRGVFARRYFHPLLCDFPAYRGGPGAEAAFPVARDVASRILCLPLHPDLSRSDQCRVIDSMRSAVVS